MWVQYQLTDEQMEWEVISAALLKRHKCTLFLDRTTTQKQRLQSKKALLSIWWDWYLQQSLQAVKNHRQVFMDPETENLPPGRQTALNQGGYSCRNHSLDEYCGTFCTMVC